MNINIINVVMGLVVALVFGLAGCGGGGGSESSVIPTTPTTPVTPAAPSSLSASATSSSQINLAWTDNSNNETEFKIERKIGTGGTYVLIATALSDAVSYNDTGLTASTTYYYRIRATNSVGDSSYFNETNAKTSVAAPTVPATPSGLSVSATSATQINLAWSDNSSNETGFKIERKIGTGGTYVLIATAVSDAVSYSDTGLTASTTYYYRIRATNSVGDSGYTNESNATTSVAPRFIDTGKGTIYDTVSNLTWLKDANCFGGMKTWTAAIDAEYNLANGQCGLSDGSKAGDWLLPTVDQLRVFVDAGYRNTTLNTVGFSNVQNGYYWTSTWYSQVFIWVVHMGNGDVYGGAGNGSSNYVWPVRIGQ